MNNNEIRDICKALGGDFRSQPECSYVKDFCNNSSFIIYMFKINSRKELSYIYEIHGLKSDIHYALRSIPCSIGDLAYRKYQVINLNGFVSDKEFIDYSLSDEYSAYAEGDEGLVYTGLPYKLSEDWNEMELFKAFDFMCRKEKALESINKLT